MARPRETIQCELKAWIDPAADREKAKIAKTCLAMRNAGGGVLLIGISDVGEFLPVPKEFDPATKFTQDDIQLIVSNYAADAFNVDVHHVALNIQPERHVVAIVVPSGIRSPVMAKRDFTHDSGPNIKTGTIYARTLKSNGTISAAPATQGDLESIMNSCFENRTADIGQFFRRHLVKENVDALRDAMHSLSKPQEKTSSQVLSDFKAESYRELKKSIEKNDE